MQMIDLHKNGVTIPSFLLILVSLSTLGASVPRAMAPSTSMIRLTQSIWIILSGILPTVHPPTMVMKQIVMLMVN